MLPLVVLRVKSSYFETDAGRMIMRAVSLSDPSRRVGKIDRHIAASLMTSAWHRIGRAEGGKCEVFSSGGMHG